MFDSTDDGLVSNERRDALKAIGAADVAGIVGCVRAYCSHRRRPENRLPHGQRSVLAFASDNTWKIRLRATDTDGRTSEKVLTCDT